MRITEILLAWFSFAGPIWYLSARTGRGGHVPNLESHLNIPPALLPPTPNSQMLSRYSQGQMTASRLKPRTLVPSSSPPLPSSSPPTSTSSAPPYTDDEKPSIRRASTDSDSSIFSHFLLTPESEAGLRAWEQAMLATPSPGPASPSNPTKPARRWVVFKGRTPGVYHSA